MAERASTRLFLTKYEVCEQLRVSLSTLNRWLKERRVSWIKIGGRVLIPAEAIMKLATAAAHEEETV